MIFMLVLLAFAFGYGYAMKREVDFANNAISEYLNNYNCLPKTGGLDNEEKGFTFNFTLYEEEIGQENTIQ